MLKEKDNFYVDDFFGLMLMDVWSWVCKLVCECGGLSMIMVDYF